MNGIGWAVKALQEGARVRRAGWNGKGMWLVYVPGMASVLMPAGTAYANAGIVTANIAPHIDMFTAAGVMQPGWLCSQADLLALDWEIAE